jgi:elongation factor G
MAARPPVQIITITITPKTVGDDALARALFQLKAEDPAIRITSADPATGRVSIAGVSELHLEVVVDRLKREFGIEAAVDRPVAFLKESLRDMALGEHKHTRAKRGRHEYAHVKLRLTPREDGAGYVFESGLVGDVLPSRFVAAAEEGIENARVFGVLSGRPIDDVKVELLDGSYHDVDSSESAFRIAGGQAFVEGALRAKPIIVEPVVRIEVSVPVKMVNDVRRHLEGRRGRIQSCDERGERHTVVARAPVRHLFGYAADLNQLTHGRATYSMRFDHYQARESYPEELNLDEGDRDSLVGAPRKPLVPSRDSAIALPEPDENDDLDNNWLRPRG